MMMMDKTELHVERAAPEDAPAVYALYRSLLDTPGCTWNEEYPDRELVEADVQGGKTLVMRTPSGEIAAAIALLAPEDDPEFASFAAWDKAVKRWGIPSRLGVAKGWQGKGLAARLLTAAMEEARRMGCDGVQFLVGKRNPIAQRAYARLGFDVCGELEAWGERWLCYQKRL